MNPNPNQLMVSQPISPDAGQYPKMTDEEMKEFISMYPYMADYPLEEIHRFWFNNIKNENMSSGSFDIDEEELKMAGAEDEILDESRNSD